jgi:hypothetical protein
MDLPSERSYQVPVAQCDAVHPVIESQNGYLPDLSAILNKIISILAPCIP